MLPFVTVTAAALLRVVSTPTHQHYNGVCGCLQANLALIVTKIADGMETIQQTYGHRVRLFRLSRECDRHWRYL
ncbi:hypothetical protein QBC41DRAFT_315547 [Cercophora samala]|uniref:Secreted protein n=1 Tax=Cercophora samala TaxID=330535 RepID=A0AA39ZI94_9PEZI|nr:hypothetical protein QBC41DRAFT_315547 [Cercophora samala]